MPQKVEFKDLAPDPAPDLDVETSLTERERQLRQKESELSEFDRSLQEFDALLIARDRNLRDREALLHARSKIHEASEQQMITSGDYEQHTEKAMGKDQRGV